MRVIAALIPCIALWPVLAAAATPEACGAPTALSDGWPVASAAQQGLDPKLICAIGPRLREMAGADPNGVVVGRHGVLVYEAYFTGADQRWPEHHWGEPLPILRHNADTKHDLSSITKNVVALLVGLPWTVVRPRPLIHPSSTSFRTTPTCTPGRARITLRDLLTMRAGLRWVYRPYLSMARQMEVAPDPCSYWNSQ